MKTMILKDSCLAEDLELLSENSLIPWEDFSGKTLLVTGATGLVGSVVMKSVLYVCEKKGIPVRVLGLVRDPGKAGRIFGEFSEQTEKTELGFVIGDISSDFDVPQHVDYIIHAASPTASKFFVTQPVETIRTAVNGTDRMLQLAVEKKVSGFVYISSMEIYGTADPGLSIVKEENLGFIDPLKVRSCYSEGKRMCECLCTAYASEYQVPVSMARLAQTFGAGVLPTENRVFAQFARSAMHGTDIVLHTKGLSEGNYCYTADAAAGILLLLLRGKRGEAYTVVNEDTHTTIRAMAEMVAHEIAEDRIKVIFDIPEDAMKFGYAPDVKLRLSGEKLMKLGWKPEVGLPEAYRRLIRSLSVYESEE